MRLRSKGREMANKKPDFDVPLSRALDQVQVLLEFTNETFQGKKKQRLQCHILRVKRYLEAEVFGDR